MTQSPSTFQPKKMVLAVVLLIGLGLSVFGVHDRVLKRCGLTPLPEQNEAYIDRAFEQSLRLFALLSVVKMGLAVVEGSEVGVGFGLELGDLVQSVYDHVDIAWRTVLVAGVLLQCLRFLLQTASLVDQWILALAFAMALISLCFSIIFKPKNWARNFASDTTLFFTILASLFYVVLPLTVTGARNLSQAITAPSLSKAEKGITQFERDLQDLEVTGLGSISKKFEQLQQLVTEKAKGLMTYLFTIIAVYVFDCVLFPLLLFFLLYRGTNLLVRYLFHLKHEHLSAHS